MGGKFHLKLNMDKRPIANKYREGKMKSTLKRELKGLEIVWRATVFEQCEVDCFCNSILGSCEFALS